MSLIPADATSTTRTTDAGNIERLWTLPADKDGRKYGLLLAVSYYKNAGNRANLYRVIVTDDPHGFTSTLYRDSLMESHPFAADLSVKRLNRAKLAAWADQVARDLADTTDPDTRAFIASAFTPEAVDA